MNDNVRKVFDMLGVEPNERFKVEGIEEPIYYIDERLYVKRENERLYSDTVLSSLLNGNFKIIKLPKEPIKKKLRDITPEEWDKWLKKNCGDCSECIFRKALCSDSRKEESWINHKDIHSDKFLNQQIEVEE